MSEPIALISSAIITEPDLSAFIVRAQGHVTPGAPLFGHFSRGESHLWIGLSTEELSAVIEDKGEEYMARLAKLLGGLPRTDVTVEISRTQGSETLALEFAILFSACWPAVVDDLAGHLLTRSDLLQRRAAGQGIRALATTS